MKLEKEKNSMFLPSYSPNQIKLGLKFNCRGYGLSTVVCRLSTMDYGLSTMD
ncbi:hypothetical protein MMU07_05495 [Aquiflexum sp. LQ15W]|uniref:hypothetical protein n=1 Tax=Cognataquiflexum nitidum TaxID=2922272 RepID=UPI001F141160|nr:hypothetical protein [Cognataquiflexum nitidum]MCH6199018.1 hypothetical protein [Cognataquiflexum nitidum]